MARSVPIAMEQLSHAFGEGELRRQVLFDVSAEIAAGEIVILTGPSGSGKTTLLTLVGALRSAQSGSLRVLGRELRGASERIRIQVRRRIGYVFQAHNLLDALTARQNVRMALDLQGGQAAGEADRRVAETLEAVGLGDRLDHLPGQLSGGQRQRVALARALVGRPEILLADEPTASLDRETGRSVVERIRSLARDAGVTVVLVTHDHRVLDVADRVLALEDGRLTGAVGAVASSTRQVLALLGRDARHGSLGQRLADLAPGAFEALLGELTSETRALLDVVEVAQDETFRDLAGQVLGALAAQLARLFPASRAEVLLLDEGGRSFWPVAAPGERAAPPVSGIAGRVARDGAVVRTAGPAREAGFEPLVDRVAGDGAGPLLAVPIEDSGGRVFAVAEVARPAGAAPFSSADEERLLGFAASVGTVLEAWWRMGCACRAAGSARAHACCAPGPEASDAIG